MESKNENSVEQRTPSRRKFLTTAAKSAAVITTVAAKPVWASNTSISGNLSGNLSGQQRQHENAYADGCSPGYYHMHEDKVQCAKSSFSQSNFPEFVFKKNKNSSTYWVISRKDSSKITDTAEYKKKFQSIFGAGYGPNSRVYRVLNAKYHNSNNGITQLDRMALTAYYNAHPTFSGVTNAYGVHGFPYTTNEVIEFYQRYVDSAGTSNAITTAQAEAILGNLIHGGGSSSNWDAWDATCR